MKFSEALQMYMDQLDCTAKELCSLSGISAASFSRYKNGERAPEAGTPAFDGLCRAIAAIAVQKSLPDITADAVCAVFTACEDVASADPEALRQNFNTLIAALNINLTRLSQYTNYDTSAIFRIRSGSRKPGDSDQFASAVASFVSREMRAASEIAAVAELIGCDAGQISDLLVRYAKIKGWLLEQPAQNTGNDSISTFLNKLDAFDLNEYIKVIRFDELKVPSVPFQIPSSKTYFGLKEMMESELDFLKATVLSRSMAPVTMYSDMPMTEMAKDPEFPKKWMFGMAMMLKKGLHLDMIHNIDRPFYEMMLGLESWIPMYMTGQISPYYLNSVQNSIFCHFLKVSGSAALWGEAIAGSHENGRYYLTKKKEEISYYKRRAADMKAHARPLMKIYRADSAAQFRQFFMQNRSSENCRGILGSLPLYTLDEACLEAILSENRISPAAAAQIRKEVLHERQFMETFLTSAQLSDEVPLLSQTEFQAHPMKLFLADLFLEDEISYSWETYKWHMDLSRQFADAHAGYQLKTASSAPFLNIQIRICEGRFVVISKNSSPAIQFVIHHPKLCRAIETMITPIVE